MGLTWGAVVLLFKFEQMTINNIALYLTCELCYGGYYILKPLTTGVNYKVIHTSINLQLKAAGLFKYIWPFTGHQTLQGSWQSLLLNDNYFLTKNKIIESQLTLEKFDLTNTSSKCLICCCLSCLSSSCWIFLKNWIFINGIDCDNWFHIEP